MPANTPQSPVTATAIEPMVVDATEAARLCGVSRAMWWKLKRSGRCPKPLRLGRRMLWSVEELRRWIADGCPPPSRWKADQYRRDAGRILGNLKK